ncbi:MAG TPA: NHL repeat-containing protein [Verrucomicrobiae bacterium]|nr:NHL repeat-containing protein [Verrucomicrobiae bacterium]
MNARQGAWLSQGVTRLGFGIILLGSSLINCVPSQADNIYVSNTGNATVVGYNSSGQQISSYSASGLFVPEGLGFDGSGNLYVVNNVSGQIDKFSPNGTESKFVGSTYQWSTALAIDNNGNVFESSPTGTEEFDKNGVLQWGAQFEASGREGMAVDANDNLYVPTGTTIAKCGTNKVQATYVTYPLSYWGASGGIAFDSSGDFFVANFALNAIYEVDTNGVMTVFANTGLNEPEGLAFDSAGNLYVANSGDGTIEEFGTNGVGTVFASGLSDPTFLATQVPEPGSWVLVVFGCGMVLGGWRLRRRVA